MKHRKTWPNLLCCLLSLAFCLPVCLAFDLNDLDLGKVAAGGSKLIKAAAGISDEEEIKIGREVAANLAAHYGMVEDEARLKYLNLVGQTVVRQCSRTDIPYHFGILKSAEINAWATPGGYIFVTEGLLNTLQDEAELAGVLAHEISHVTQKHIVKAIRQANLLGAGEDLAAAAGKPVDRYAQLSDFSINLLSKGLSRGDELEADKLGTPLAAKAGYDPAGLRDSITRLSQQKTQDTALAHFTQTHPPAADRIRVINESLFRNNLAEKGPRLKERFQKVFRI